MQSDILLVFRTLTLLVAVINVIFLHAGKKSCLKKELSKNLCSISVFSDNSYMLPF